MEKVNKTEREIMQFHEFKSELPKYLMFDDTVSEEWLYDFYEDFKSMQYPTLKEWCEFFFAPDIVNKNTHTYWLK